MEEFKRSSERLRKKSTAISNDVLLILYGLYKQVMEGNCTAPQPWSVQIVERSRWDAWYKNMNMKREDAIRKYIEMVNILMEEECKEIIT